MTAANKKADPATVDDPEHGAGAPPIQQFTSPHDGSPVYVDPVSVTHVQRVPANVPHSNEKRAAAGDTEPGFLTELGTTGGLVIRVLDDLEAVAKALGWF